MNGYANLKAKEPKMQESNMITHKEPSPMTRKISLDFDGGLHAYRNDQIMEG